MGTFEDGGVMKQDPTDLGSPVEPTPERASQLGKHDEPICASDHLSAKISELKRCGFRVELFTRGGAI